MAAFSRRLFAFIQVHALPFLPPSRLLTCQALLKSRLVRESCLKQVLILAHTLRMPGWKVLRKIYLPTVMPYFFSGARLAFGFGWRVSLVAETIGASSGAT